MLLAYRYDLPDDMMPMVINAGHWQIVDEDIVVVEVLFEVKALIGRVKLGLCMNLKGVQ